MPDPAQWPHRRRARPNRRVRPSVTIAHATPAALRGRALGVLSTAVYLGQFLSPLASQPVARAASTGSAFGAAALCALVAAALAVLAASRRRRSVLERAA